MLTPTAAAGDPAGDDDALLVRAGAGDPDACQWLYERFAPVVHGIALSHVGRQDAEDLTQDVFATVYRQLQTVRGDGALASWICAVARNQAIDHLRRRQRQPAHEPLREVADRETAAEDAAAALTSRVLAMVMTLPDAYRETLVLRLVEGLTGPEIAQRTGLTQGSVRVNLCRGMAMLRPKLEQEGWS